MSPKEAPKPVKLAPIKSKIKDDLHEGVSKFLKVANNEKGGVSATITLPPWLAPGDIMAILFAIGQVIEKYIDQLLNKPGK